MKAVVAIVVLLIGSQTGARGPQQVRLTGGKAFQLISLLASGTEAIRSAIAEGGQSHIVIHDLRVLSEATFKYDPDQVPFQLGLYSASGKVGAAEEATRIGEATGLWTLLRDAGISGSVAAEGGYLEIRMIDCTINAKASISDATRFRCDITAAF
jgi:hypothetical protein